MPEIKHFFSKRMLLLRFALWFSLGNAVLCWLIGIKFLSIILASKTLFETSFYAYTTFFGKAWVIFFTVISFLGHFSLLAFLPTLLIVWPLICITQNRSLIFMASILSGSFVATVLLIDSFVFRYFHFHLNFTLLEIAFGSEYNFIAFFDLSRYELLLIIGMCALILSFEILLAWVIWQWIILKDRWHIGSKLYAALMGCLGFSYMIFVLSIANGNNVFAQQTPNLPLYNNFLAAVLPMKNSFELVERFSETRFSQPLFPVAPLHYPLNPLNCRAGKKPYNIVVIGIDTWRFDALNKTLTPKMDAFANTAWRFNRHMSGGNSTQAGLFSLFYGLPSNYWSSMSQQKQGALLFSELAKQHYQTKIMFSSDMIPAFNENIFYGIPNLRTSHEPGETIPDRDASVTNEFKTFLKERNSKQPFMTFLLYDSAHGYCSYQNFQKLFPSVSRDCSRMTVSNKDDERELVNRYKNAVHFIDEQVGQVINILKQRGLLNNTVIVLTGDHGEEFDDNRLGYIGHGSNYTRYQIQTPLVIYVPRQKPSVWAQETSHYDIAPYLMKNFLGCRNPNEDYSLGKDLLGSHVPPYLLVGSYINMAMVEKFRNTTFLTSGNIRIADNHANELPLAKPNMALVTKALFDMRKYYQH